MGKKGTKKAKKTEAKQLDPDPVEAPEELDLESLADEIPPDEDGDDTHTIDVSNFFNYQRAINSLIDYLNRSIDDTIAGFTHSDQKLFQHLGKKLILNAILENGFYEFCKYRLALITEEEEVLHSEDEFIEVMETVQGEIDLLAYLLVNSRLAHRLLTFDLYLSLLQGGLFADIMEIHEKIVKDMKQQKQTVNKSNISSIKVDGPSNLYI